MNMMKTYLLLLLMTAILTGFGWALDYFLGGGGRFVWIFFFIAIVMNWVTYFFSDKIVLAMYGARPLSESEAPQLHEMLGRLAQRAGIPKPPLYLVPVEVPNAFATGRSPQRAAVAVTEGLLRAMTPEQIEGVLAHELGHIRHRDTLVATIAATLTAAISMASSSARWGLLLGGGRRDSEGNSNPLGLILGILMTILAPIIAMLVQMAISRSREYAADEFAARTTGNPEGLASALERLELIAQRMPMEELAATENLCIVSPLSGEEVASWFSTHPPTHKRIARLRQLARELSIGRMH